jgi:hypothetical protein
MTDQVTIDRIEKFIADLQAQKAALHPEQKPVSAGPEAATGRAGPEYACTQARSPRGWRHARPFLIGISTSPAILKAEIRAAVEHLCSASLRERPRWHGAGYHRDCVREVANGLPPGPRDPLDDDLPGG